MIDVSKLPPYLSKKTQIFFPKLKQKPYEVHILVENANLLELYPDLNLSRQYHKYITAQSFITKKPTKYLYHFEQNYHLLPVPYERRHKVNETLLVDTSFAKIQLIQRYHITQFRTARSIKIMDDLLEVDADKTNVLLYVVDVDKPFAIPLYKRTIWPWLLHIKRNNDFKFDQAITAILDNGQVTYVNLGTKDKYNLQRIIATLKHIKPKHIQSLDSILEDYVHDNVERYAIKHYLAHHPEMLQQVVDNYAKIDWQKLANKAIVYLATGSDEKVNSVTDKKVIEDLKKSILVRTFTPVQSSDPILKETNIDKHITAPDGVYSYKQEEYIKNLHRDITHVLSSFKTQDIPLKVKDIKVVPVGTPPNELRQTKLIKFIITVEDHEGITQKIEIMLPKLEGNTFTIYGKQYTLINQLALKPLSFPKPYTFKLLTSYSAISGTYKLPTKQTSYFHMFIGGMQQPACLFLTYMYGLDRALKLFNITRYTISDVKTGKNCYKLGDKFLIIDQDLEKYQQAFVNGFNKLKYPENVSYDDSNFWSETIVTCTKNFNAKVILTNIFNNILDLATQEVLRQELLPTKLDELLVYACKKIIDPNNVDERNDLSIQRLRQSEIISQYVRKMLYTAYSAYAVKRQLGDTSAKIEFSNQKLLSQIVQDPNMQAVEKSSPVEELSYLSRLSPTGLGGVPTAEAITTQYRNVHTSYYGNISAMDTPESGKVGATQHLAIGATIQNRGAFPIHKLDDALGEKILSPIEALIPFVNYNEGARVLFATNQMRSAIPTTHNEPPIVQTGYESLLTRYLSDSFIIKAPCDGTVSVSPENIMTIKCNDGTVKRYDLNPQGLRSGQIPNVSNKYIVHAKSGPIKKGQVLASSEHLKDNIISYGVNLHTVVMSYRGYNFEDAIVISESTSNKMTSRHLEDITIQITQNSKIFHINTSIGQEIKAGAPLLEFVPSNLAEFIELLDEDLDSVTGSTVTIRCPYDGKIVDIEVYPGDISYLVKFPQLKPLYERIIKRLTQKHGKKIPKEFKYNGNKIDGVIVTFKIEFEMPMSRGDKFANRHGNKGVVGLVLPDDMMPKTPFGHAEIVINPLGIEGRSNLGQLLELYVGLISYKVSQLIATLPRAEALEVIKNVYYLLNPNFRDIVLRFRAMSKEEWDNLVWKIKADGYKVPIIISPFTKRYVKVIKKCLAYLNLQTKYRVFIPELDTYTKYPVPVGWCYWEKLEHIAAFKLSARSTRTYISKTLQPPSGKKKEGGQRLGELDSWALLAHDCPNLFWELWGSLADDHVAKQQLIKNIIENGRSDTIKPTFMPTRDAFVSMLLGLHLEVVDPLSFSGLK